MSISLSEICIRSQVGFGGALTVDVKLVRKARRVALRSDLCRSYTSYDHTSFFSEYPNVSIYPVPFLASATDTTSRSSTCGTSSSGV